MLHSWLPRAIARSPYRPVRQEHLETADEPAEPRDEHSTPKVKDPIARGLLALLSILNVLALLLLWVAKPQICLSSCDASSVPQEANGRGGSESAGPRLPRVPQTFQSNESFMPPSSTAWFDFLSELPGKGFVYAPSPRPSNLPPGVQTPTGEVFSVSLFHQLHCLTDIRSHYFKLLNSTTSLPDEDRDPDPSEAYHVAHCFDYLRQAIMCAGDLALEGLAKPGSAGEEAPKLPIDGWGMEHRCVDWDAIQRYLMVNGWDGLVANSTMPGQ